MRVRLRLTELVACAEGLSLGPVLQVRDRERIAIGLGPAAAAAHRVVDSSDRNHGKTSDDGENQGHRPHASCTASSPRHLSLVC